MSEEQLYLVCGDEILDDGTVGIVFIFQDPETRQFCAIDDVLGAAQLPHDVAINIAASFENSRIPNLSNFRLVSVNNENLDLFSPTIHAITQSATEALKQDLQGKGDQNENNMQNQ